MRPNRPRVAFDARYLSHGLIGGVHTYTLNLVNTMLRVDLPFDLDIWIDAKAPADIAPDPQSRGGVRVLTLPYRNELSSIANDLRIGGAMRSNGADLAHFPANVGLTPRHLPAVITLHDAINILPLHQIIAGHAKHPRTVATMTYLHLLTRRSVRRQPMLITVSEYSRREILRHARLQPDQVRVVPNAPNPAFSVRPRTVAEAFRARLGLRNHVIAADAIKNPATVLAAYRRLPDELREQTSLVFFSRRMPASEVVAASQSGECTLLLKPSIDDLVVLLNLAELLVFPSLYEGFGLPVVEAMSCGTPVIASNVGSLPEIVADTGIVVEPLDPTAIAAAVTQLLLHPLQRRDLAARATRRAARYSWEATMRATIDVYMDALSSAQSPVNQPARQPTAS